MEKVSPRPKSGKRARGMRSVRQMIIEEVWSSFQNQKKTGGQVYTTWVWKKRGIGCWQGDYRVRGKGGKKRAPKKKQGNVEVGVRKGIISYNKKYGNFDSISRRKRERSLASTKEEMTRT